VSTRTPEQACLWGRKQHENPSRNWTGMCQMFARSCFNVGALYGSASSAWDHADYRHPLSDGNLAPRGVPFYWKGGSRGFGHVALSVGSGLAWTTDVVRAGKVDLVRINDITRHWGQRPMGWAEDINNVHVFKLPAVDLSDLVAAAKRDPKRATGHGTGGAIAAVIRFERSLAARGYLNHAYADGSYGTKTIAAMHRYQHDHGFKGNGLPTSDSVKSVIKGRYRLVG
jgi:hypothetical protein